MKKVTEEEFQIMFFKNLFKKIVKSYLYEGRNFEKIFDNMKALDNAKLIKFNELNDENAEKLAKKFVEEMRKGGKAFESILKDEKKLIEWTLKNLYIELK